MSGSFSGDARVGEALGSLSPFHLRIAEKFKTKRADSFYVVPDILWSARYSLDLASVADVKERCKQKGMKFKSKTYKSDFVQSLLDTPGEMELAWEAFGLSVDELASICQRTYPGLMPTTLESITSKELIRQLVENERKIAQDRQDLRKLLQRESGGFTGEDTDLICRQMAEARQRDVWGGLLEGDYRHFHRRIFAAPLVVLLDKPGAKEAIMSNERLMAEVRSWVELGPEPRAVFVGSGVCYLDSSVECNLPSLSLAWAALLLKFKDAPHLKELKYPEGNSEEELQAARDMKLPANKLEDLPYGRLAVVRDRFFTKSEMYDKGVGRTDRTNAYMDLVGRCDSLLRKHMKAAMMPCPKREEDSDGEKEAKKLRAE
eukprot:jgi/Mesvir1/27570/Mv07315-RA.1